MDTKEFRRLLFVLCLIALLTLPSLLYLGSFDYSGKITPERIKGHLEFYFRSLNKYLFPWGMLFLSLALFSKYRKKVFPLLGKTTEGSGVWLIVLLFIFTIGFLLLADERQLRYLIHLLPFCSILIAVLVYGLNKINGLLSAVLFFLITFTNVVHVGSPLRKPLQIPLKDIAYELSHNYCGPVEGIINFLSRNAAAADTVKLVYGDFAVIFYTNLKVDNGPFQNETYPEWIIPRKEWFSFERLKQLNPAYASRIASDYRRIEINYPDILWENRPDPGYHKFRSPVDGSRVVIYQKRKVN